MSRPLVRLLFSLCLELAESGCQRGDVSLGELRALTMPAGREPGTLPPSAAMMQDASPSANVAGRDLGGNGPSGANPGNRPHDAPNGRPPMLQPLSGGGGVMAMPMAGSSSVAARPSTGCGKEPATVETSITVSGMRASYVLDLPLAYDKTRAYPVIMAFRASGMSAETFRSALGLSAIAASDAIVAYPNCLNDAPAWDAQRDRMLFDALLAKLEGAYCVDRDHVYAMGHGSGSMFASALGCLRGDVVRGFAAFSSAPPPPPPGNCTGEPAVWIAQGIGDPMLGLGRAHRDFWLEHNGCNPTLTTPVAPTPCVAYGGCNDGAPVRYCEHTGDPSVPSFAASGAYDFFKAL